MKHRRAKKPIYKKWWFWTIIALLVIGAFGGSDSEDVSTNDIETEAVAELEESVAEAALSKDEAETEDDLAADAIETVASEDEAEIEDATEAELSFESLSAGEENTNLPEERPSDFISAAQTLPSDSIFSIHFIDVGQADAALIECDGHYMLIDGGNKEDSNVIFSVLKKAAVPKLDIVVGTHAHEDHIGGIPGAFNYTTADLTLCPVTSYDSNAFEDFAQYADQKGGGITVPSVGDIYSLGSASVEILGVNGGSDTNDTSIVLMIKYGDTSFLFTGDAERDAEQAILSSGADLSATVLKVGHHGSDTSTTYPFLREIMPEYAVISVGSGNSYGHPTEDALSRLRDADVTVFRTDLQGDIFCTSDGKSVTLSTSRNADIDVFDNIGENSTQTAAPEVESPIVDTPVSDSNEVETPAPAPQAPSSEMVWIPNSGTKYHNNSGCSGMKNPTQVTIEDAQAMGFTACKKCY